ncbi:MAG: LuxR family transcriptional regulator [Aquisalinus sp.]|nr:LuxR family transcriptional regulator [Aquisalinus sp.]
MIGNVDAYARNVRDANSFGELRKACITYLPTFGAEMFSYHHLPPPGAIDHNEALTVIAYGFPIDWVNRYTKEKLYLNDPITRLASDVSEPFWWSHAAKTGPISTLEKKYLDTLAAEHLGDGLAIPVFGPHGRNGYCGVGFGHHPPELSYEDIKKFQWVCQLGHTRYCDLLKKQLPEAEHLTARETEILEWVAKGKSNTVIAEIIGISPHTVDTYMRRIYLKFGVADRVTAALRGLAVGAL